MRSRLTALLSATTLLAGLLVGISATPSYAATVYFVDAAKGSDATGNGSASKPWKTISKAASTVSAGDAVRIRSGTYRETVRPAHSGTTDRPITYEAEAGANVTVSGANVINGHWSAYKDDIYSIHADLPMGEYLDSVYVDGVANNLARSPNTPVGNLYDPNFWNRDAKNSNAGLLHDPVNLNQPAGTWDGAALFVEDSGSWNFSSALVDHSTPGDLHIKDTQRSYSVKLSSYDNTVQLVAPDGTVLGTHAMTISPDTTYRVTVRAIGSRLEVFVNDTPVLSATDAQVAEGSFGLGVSSSSDTVAARADFTKVNATIIKDDPAHRWSGLAAPTFASNIDGWNDAQDGWWTSDGTTMHGYTQPQTKDSTATYETTEVAKDFLYSADVTLRSQAIASLTFRKELMPGYVIDLADWGLDGSEYFIMGKLAALDYPGEWYYDESAHRLYLETTGEDNPAQHTIEYKARNLAFDLSDRSNIVVRGVNLFGASIDTARGSHDVIDRIHAKYVTEYNLQYASRGSGICLCGTDDTLENSEIAYSSGSLVTMKGDGSRLVNNVIHDGTYGGIVFNSAIELAGRNQLISNNTVYHSGRSLIGGDFYADLIQYNDFYGGNYFAHDTGMLYTAHDELGNTVIAHNYWHDNPHRSNGEGDWTGGIYLDESSSDALVYDNTTWNLTWHAIQVNHISDFVQVYNNTTYKSSDIEISQPSYGLDAFGDRVQNNIAVDGMPSGATDIGAFYGNNLSSGDPKYVDPATHDLRPQPGSPAIDAGTPVRGVTDGYQGSAPDIGAYESGGPTWTAGANLTDPPPAPAYHLVDTDYQNVVRNGTFDLPRLQEPGVTGLTDWTPTYAKTAQPTYDISGGKVSARIAYRTGMALGTGEDGLEQKITGLKPDTTYHIRGYLRADSDGQTVRLGVKDYGGADTYQETGSTSWTQEDLTFATGPDSTSATLYAYKPTTGGYAFVDDIMMYAPQITLSVNDTAVTEGNSGSAPATFTVSLSGPSKGTVNVDYATADGTATAPGDYTATSGTLTFAPGETSKQVSVPVVGDTVSEPDERFTLNLSNATGATIADGVGTGIILNDEPPPPGVTIVNDHTTGTGTNQFEFVGSWATNTNPTAYQNDVTFSMNTDDYYQVRFNGTQIQLYSELGPVMGIVGVSIDGGSESKVDNYSPTDIGDVMVYSSPTLPAGQHILKVRVTGTENASGAGTWTVADRVDIHS